MLHCRRKAGAILHLGWISAAFSSLGPVPGTPQELFGPVKPFLVHLYLTTERSMHLKLLV